MSVPDDGDIVPVCGSKSGQIPTSHFVKQNRDGVDANDRRRLRKGEQPAMQSVVVYECRIVSVFIRSGNGLEFLL